VNPDVAAAVGRLERESVLTPSQALIPRRVARGELLSIRFELRTALWLGVSLIAGGVGLLVKDNLDRIGPVTIAITLGFAAAACLLWVGRVAPPFTWHAQPSPNLAFDYVLLLGAMLIAADLAFIEFRFTPLGANWPWHLLWTAVLYGALAARFDSRILASLALTTFAAWRGVAMGTVASAPFGRWEAAPVRWNALACGVAFVALGWLLAWLDRKAHFEPVASHLGWLLVLGALASGMTGWQNQATWMIWALALLAVGVALVMAAARARRIWLFAFGLIGAYAAASRFVTEVLPHGTARQLYFIVTSVVVIVALVIAERRLEENP